MKSIGLHNVQSFFLIYFLPEKQETCRQRQFQNAVVDVTAYNHNTIPLENISPLIVLTKQLNYFHEQLFTYQACIYLRKLPYFLKQQKQIEIMFDGQDGDNVISHGGERFPELLKGLEFDHFIYEIFCYSLFNKVKLKNTISSFWISYSSMIGLRLPRLGITL